MGSKRRSDSPVEPPEVLTGPLTARDCTSNNRIARTATGSVGCSSGREGPSVVGEACASRAGEDRDRGWNTGTTYWVHFSSLKSEEASLHFKGHYAPKQRIRPASA